MNSKKAQIAIIAIFLVFTFALSITFFALPKADFSAQEKRSLSKFPEISFDSFLKGNLTAGLEGENGGFIPDHFPLRSFFVATNAYMNLLLGNTAGTNYYNCDDGYIVTKPPSSDRSKINLRLLGDFAASFDEVTLAVVPSPGYIMEDKLPLIHADYKDDAVFDLINSKKAANIKLCDLREVFKASYTAGTDLYYKTDHHWTTKGAFIAYNALCNTMDIEPADMDNFRIKSHDGFYGTTYSSSGYFLNAPDTLEIWENENFSDSIKLTISDTDKGEIRNREYSSMYFEERLSEPDMYPVFLNGNQPVVTIENSKAQTDKTLLIFKDSYAHAITPFFAENYQKIVMVDMRYYDINAFGLVSEFAKNINADDCLFLYSMDSFMTDNSFAYLF